MAPQNARQGSRRHLAQHRAQRRTRKRLEPLGHHGHAEQEQPTPPRIEIVVDMNPLTLALSRLLELDQRISTVIPSSY